MAVFKASFAFVLLVSSSFLVLTIRVGANQITANNDNKTHTIVKRQSSPARLDTSNNSQRPDQIGPSGGGGGGGGRVTALSVASSYAGSGENGPSGLANESNSPSQPRRPKVRPQQKQQQQQQVDEPVDSEGEPAGLDDQVARPNRKRRPLQSRRPLAKRPADSYGSRRANNYADDDDSQDENCDEYGDDSDYNYGTNFFQMATRPMRQFSNMMNNAFEQMQGLASGDMYDNYPSSGNSQYAISSSRSDGDGYSRVSSISNVNGRTRGLVSETRNGRTKTSRIGDDTDDSSSGSF